MVAFLGFNSVTGSEFNSGSLVSTLNQEAPATTQPLIPTPSKTSLDISDINSIQLDINSYKGPLFENLIVVDFIKNRFNQAKSNNLYFWRDSMGNELDILIEVGNSLIPIEIKSGQTITNEYFKGLKYWHKISGEDTQGYVVYAGQNIEKRSNNVTVLPFNEISSIDV
jgi:predicted AAA+ superfamily ATPase